MSLDSHSAEGPAAGFVFQFERALLWLSKSPKGSIVGIETEDDVVRRLSDGNTVYEQNKHTIRPTHQCFGEKSRDLWHTLLVWLQAISNGEIDLHKSQMFLVTNSSVPHGLVRRINDATNDTQARACFEELSQLAVAPPKNLAVEMKKVIGYGEKTVSDLITKIALCDSTIAHQADSTLKQVADNLTIPGGLSPNSVVNELAGWLQRMVVNDWRNQRPAWISRDAFVNEFQAILSRKARERTRERTKLLLPLSPSEVGAEKQRTFVRQVELITDAEVIIIGAISDFLRASRERLRLSKEGEVTDEDWAAFDSRLKDRWDRIQQRVHRLYRSDDNQSRGFRVFTDVTDEYRERLAGQDTDEVYLTAGTYHRLADVLDVGWHPEYRTILDSNR